MIVAARNPINEDLFGVGPAKTPRDGSFDVRGLEVAMDDSFLVRRVERVGDLPADRERLRNSDCSRGTA